MVSHDVEKERRGTPPLSRSRQAVCITGLIAGLLAIAVLGAVISAQFDASVGAEIATGPLTAEAPEASTDAFHLGVLIAGLLMIVGGIVSGLWIENPEKRVEAVPAGAAAAAGECGHEAQPA